MSSARYGRPLGLTLWYATLFVAGSLLIVLLTYVLTANLLAQRDRQIIRAKAGEYADIYARGGLSLLASTAQAEQRRAPERLFIRVVGQNAEAVVLSDREGWDPATLETAAVQLRDGTIVQVGKSSEARRDILARFRTALGFVTLSIIVVALSGGWLATQSALQPIRRLTDAVQRVAATGRIDERVPLGEHDDELEGLTRQFNAMLDRIERLVNGMRGALDNVSHDLRTPLTRLRGTAELALAASPDAGRDREALADCVEECDRVLLMLNTLMDISEAESGAMPLTREPVALAGVVGRALDLYGDVAEAKGVVMTSEVAPDVIVMGDRIRLEQVAANLVDNAVKYTPAGGTIVIRVSRDDRSGVIRVENSGPGIPPDELPHVWDRLFRGDKSRAERGLGLGLSLVKAVVEAHGGAVEATSQVGHGAVFTVRIPSITPM